MTWNDLQGLPRRPTESRYLNALEGSQVPEVLVTLCCLAGQISHISPKERVSVDTLSLPSSPSCLAAPVLAYALLDLGSAGGRAGLSSLESALPRYEGWRFPSLSLSGAGDTIPPSAFCRWIRAHESSESQP